MNHDEMKKLKRDEEAETRMLTALSAVSHEMKNLLTLILGNSRLLEQEHPALLSDGHWKSIRSDLLHLKALLTDLSAFRKMEAGPSRFQLFDLSALLRDTCRSCEGWFDGIHRRLILSCPEQAAVLFGDRLRIREAVVNLIKNGLEALDAEGTVSVRLRQENGWLVIEVKDTGRGLDRHELENVLRPFYTTKEEGTGLGLPIAEAAARAHGGSLSLSSEAGKGTAALLSLPLLPGSDEQKPHKEA